MSVMRVITHIFPTTASPENYDALLPAHSIDVPERVVTSNFTDPRSGINYTMQTTFCKEFPVKPGTDADDLLARQCEAIPGLKLLKKYDKTVPPTDEICVQPGALDYDFPVTLGIPLKMGKSKNDTCKLGHSMSKSKVSDQIRFVSDLQEGTSIESSPMENSSMSKDAVDKLSVYDIETVDDPLNESVQNNDVLKELPSESNGTSEGLDSSGGETVDDVLTEPISIQDLIEPLEKYFVDNKCFLCGFVSTCKSKRNAKYHLLKHLTSKNFKCTVCDKAFKTPAGLSVHKAIHLQKRDYFSCKVCNKKFSCRRNLGRHERDHHNPVSSSCQVCNRVFTTETLLKSHMSIHTGEKPFPCDICNEKFRTTRSLFVHKTTHSKPEDHLSCKVCGKKFRYQTVLNIHMNKHEQSRKFKCEFCDKTFNFHSNMLQHKLVHLEVRRHCCKFCDMKFKFPHHLKNHMVIHK